MGWSSEWTDSGIFAVISFYVSFLRAFRSYLVVDYKAGVNIIVAVMIFFLMLREQN